jgi:hypothetical protein
MDKYQTYCFREALDEYVEGFGRVQVAQGTQFIIKGFLLDGTPVIFFPVDGTCLPRGAAKTVARNEARFVKRTSPSVVLGGPSGSGDGDSDGSGQEGCLSCGYYGNGGRFPCTVCCRGKMDCYIPREAELMRDNGEMEMEF